MTTIAEILEALVARPGASRTLEAGEPLFRAGDRVTALYVIVAGRLRLVRPGSAGAEVTLHRAAAGEAFAEPSLFAERYHCDAVAETAARVRAYPKGAILAALGTRPEQALRFTRHLAGQVQTARSRAEILSLHTAADRVLAYLRLHLPSGSNALDIDQSWKQLASELGLTHEALYRTLARLEREGRIQRSGRRVSLMR
ncbi:Crp/Fnr family transcriptional regulator [Halomonas sp. M4R5S39]|uniref:Crp/Fnr family transcriptional regulator n=1 Tax=Halomonas kalidii TaxID=3043293 RepID=UPI0024A91C47|nr:Crp/Fnr family transcriptional regulator [Halomonas kalidii]MDI5986551.1 Crp/Fnr family transcriptional regulator [Halomonas kalidii]